MNIERLWGRVCVHTSIMPNFPEFTVHDAIMVHVRLPFQFDLETTYAVRADSTAGSLLTQLHLDPFAYCVAISLHESPVSRFVDLFSQTYVVAPDVVAKVTSLDRADRDAAEAAASGAASSTGGGAPRRRRSKTPKPRRSKTPKPRRSKTRQKKRSNTPRRRRRVSAHRRK